MRESDSWFNSASAFLVKAAAHGISQGLLSMVQNHGAGFLSGAAAGFFGDLGATAWSAGAGKFASSTVGTVAFGALSGGVGAELTGGNFWQGAVTGGIVAGLNTVMHKIDDNIRENRLSRQLGEIAKNDDPGKSLVERISNAVDGLGLGNATKVAILKFAQGLSSASDFPAEYFKSFSKLSTALGYASAIVSYNEFEVNI